MFVHEASMNIHDLSQFSMEAGRFASCIQIQYGKKIVNAKSMVLVLSLAACKGTAVTISATGADAEQAVDALARLVESGLGEV